MRGRIRETLLTSLAAVLLAAGCAGDGGQQVQLPNSPERLAVGLQDGDALLRHESGLGFPVTVVDGVVEPPVLWDGVWEVTGDSERERVRVGTPVDEGVDVDELIACWGGSGPETPITAATIACTQSIMIALAAEGGYTRAAGVLAEALERSGGRTRANWGWYCHIGGDIAAAAAVLYGADARELMIREPSFCDFSVLHGAAAAAVTLAPQEAARTLTTICAPSSESPIEPQAFTSQCWHGGGIGLARLHRFDPLQGIPVCRQAPSIAARDNCSEGLFALWRTYSARLSGSEWEHIDVTVDGCNGLDPAALAEDGFAVACYRNAAIMEFIGINGRGNGARSRNLAVILEPTMEAFAEGCDRAPVDPARRACWVGYANLLTDLLDFHLDDRDFVVERLGLCDRADDWRVECYQRLVIGVVWTDQRRRGMALDDVLQRIPRDVVDDVETQTLSWLASIEGRSS